MPDLPQIAPEELAQRLDRGEPVQVLDIRAAEKVARGRVTLGPALDFKAIPGSRIYQLPSLDAAGLGAGAPVAVMCGHGNSSKPMTTFLRDKGLEAYSVVGGMAAWEAVYVGRGLAPTPSFERVVQLDRVGKGALSYVLVSEGEAVVVDPGRHVERYEAVLRELGARPVAVVETHMHADYLSGAKTAAARWSVPYYLHPDDARSPYDDTHGRVRTRPIGEGDQVTVGRATLRVEHLPGHTLGSVALVSDDGLALTGDFLLLKSVGRPDLGGQATAWAKLLWASLERARSSWPGDLLVLPAHYASERERRADRGVAARFDVVAATNVAATIQDEPTFVRWVADNTPPPPEAYRTIKLANLGLVEPVPSAADVEVLESGPNQCAVPGAV
jgi:glyoxylase-like metal-dependent hydrolase (beta-lactamase superfamily II)/rhodanese-related sulfurtransferase